MKKIICIFIFSLLLEVQAEISINSAFPNLTFSKPVDLQNDGVSNQLYAVEQDGKIKSFLNDLNTSTTITVLDLSNKISTDGEQGLLGLVFSPEFSSNGFFYVNYTRKDDGSTIISRFKMTNNIADPESELILLTVKQPFSNHNGGGLAFDGRGFLLIALGDGGSGGDPKNRAQNLRNLLGKILRIDVNQKQGRKNYAIPRSNPYAKNNNNLRKEIFAYGFRNPWRISFDAPSNTIFAADVGQSSFEEVNIVSRGRNYGWRLFEGKSKFNCPAPCKTKTTFPIHQYSHDIGQSITGGYVYRGSITELFGKYIFADFVSGSVFSLSKLETRYLSEKILDSGFNISSFGQDLQKELYICAYDQGKIYKFN